MELKGATLKNVRLFKEKAIVFDGNTELRMPNEGGKSTIADAITFVLIGKLYSGSSDLASLKPVNNPELEVSVELDYLSEDGHQLILKKEYKENWVKTRGTNETTMQGHTTTCYINDKKLAIRTYESELCERFNVSNTTELNILLNPYYFSQNLGWKERLEYVKKVTGEITPEDVFETAPETMEIKEDLQRVDFDISALKQKNRNIIKDKKERINTTSIQIKGYTAQEELISKEEADAAEKKISENQEKITNLRVKKQGDKNPVLEGLQKKRDAIKENLEKSKEADYKEKEKRNEKVVKASEELKEKRQAKYDARNEIVSNVRSLQDQITAAEEKHKTTIGLIGNKETQKSKLLEKWYQTRDKKYEPIQSLICDNCGHDLSAAKNEAELVAFNKAKTKEMKNIEIQGETINKEIAALEKTKKEQAELIKTLNSNVEVEQKAKDNIEKEIQELNRQIIKNDENKVYQFESEETREIRLKLDSIQVEIANEENNNAGFAEIDKEISELKEENFELQKKVVEYQAQQSMNNRKNRLEQELEEQTMDLSESERQDDLLTIYSETYLQILTARAEMHFPEIKFKFIEQNIKEGSWNEVCYVMIETAYGLVPYDTANTANKIKIGVKIANQLAKALGWKRVPMVIDNSEAITDSNRTFDTETQIITLVAKDATEGE